MLACIVTQLQSQPVIETDTKLTEEINSYIITVDKPVYSFELTDSNYTIRIREEEKKRKEREYKRSVLAREGRVGVIATDYTNNCVAYAKNQTGIYGTLGNGARKAIQGREPQVGAIGSLTGIPHAVVVTNVDGEYITFKESNYRWNVITERTLHINQFIGFIYS